MPQPVAAASACLYFSFAKALCCMPPEVPVWLFYSKVQTFLKVTICTLKNVQYLGFIEIKILGYFFYRARQFFGLFYFILYQHWQIFALCVQTLIVVSLASNPFQAQIHSTERIFGKHVKAVPFMV